MVAIGVIIIFYSLLQIRLIGMPSTGDEPEYIYRAISFWKTGGFHLPVSSFGAIFPRFQWLVNSRFSPIPGHPVVMSIMASPLAGVLGVAGLRSFSLFFTIFAFVSVVYLIKPYVGVGVSLISSFLMIFLLPGLAYSHLFYTDSTLMGLVAISWCLGRASGSILPQIGVLCALLLPFIHVRSSLVSAALVSFILVRSLHYRNYKSLLVSLAMTLVGGVLFLIHQYLLFGRLIDGASATFKPSFSGILPRVAVQTIDFRHGLLTVNPFAVVSFSGLIVAAIKRKQVALEGIIILAVYVPMMIWGTASESWPARFWVSVLPALAVGTGYALISLKGWVAKSAAGFLLLISVINSRILLHNNGKFLENRMGSLTYDEDFPWHNHVDFAPLLPWDQFNFEVFGINPALDIDYRLMTYVGLFFVFLFFLFLTNEFTKKRSFSMLTGCMSVAVIVGGLFFACMSPMKTTSYTLLKSNGDIVLSLNCASRVRAIRLLGSPRALMIPPAFPSEIIVKTVSETGEDKTWKAPMSPVIEMPWGVYKNIQIAGVGEKKYDLWKNLQIVPLTFGVVRRCK